MTLVDTNIWSNLVAFHYRDYEQYHKLTQNFKSVENLYQQLSPMVKNKVLYDKKLFDVSLVGKPSSEFILHPGEESHYPINFRKWYFTANGEGIWSIHPSYLYCVAITVYLNVDGCWLFRIKFYDDRYDKIRREEWYNLDSINQLFDRINDCFDNMVVESQINLENISTSTELVQLFTYKLTEFLNRDITKIPACFVGWPTVINTKDGYRIEITELGLFGGKLRKIRRFYKKDTVKKRVISYHDPKTDNMLDAEIDDQNRLKIYETIEGRERLLSCGMGYKLAVTRDEHRDYCVVVLQIPEMSKVAAGDNYCTKLRTDLAVVLSIHKLIINEDSISIDEEKIPSARSCITKLDGKRLVYHSGRQVVAKEFDPSLEKVCVPGIHFFLTIEDIVKYLDGSGFNMFNLTNDFTVKNKSALGNLHIDDNYGLKS